MLLEHCHKSKSICCKRLDSKTRRSSIVIEKFSNPALTHADSVVPGTKFNYRAFASCGINNMNMKDASSVLDFHTYLDGPIVCVSVFLDMSWMQTCPTHDTPGCRCGRSERGKRVS